MTKKQLSTIHKVPEISSNQLSVRRGLQVAMHWHHFAFEILPAPFGNKKLLDVGCGGGGVMLKAAEKGWQVTGIDAAPKNIEFLRQRGHLAEIVDLNGDLPFENESFSFVTFIEVAEHLVRAEHTFSEISRVLTTNGKMLFTTPNNASYRRRLKALKGRAPDDEGYHLRFWVKRQLESILRNVGFKVEQANSYGYLPFLDTLTLYKTRTGKRCIFRISRKFEALFADRFVWLLIKNK